MNECGASPELDGAVCRMMDVAIVTEKGRNRGVLRRISAGASVMLT